MKIVVQRVKNAQVKVDEKTVGKIEKGLLIFLGIGKNDDEKIADKFVKKICKLRIFEDENKKMNKSVKDINGDILIISQFTLYANCKSGNRPSFTEACEPQKANKLYEYFKKMCSKELERNIQSGVFGADMKVELLNDGPVTIILDSEEIN
ncbi:d-tyrosyl-tRNA(Tyr) deacylase [Clostridium sp. CAG:492]|nr:d-tyrosyl-tRNA(Tyr) deacylase [Clostridium sp. CAG:492]